MKKSLIDAWTGEGLVLAIGRQRVELGHLPAGQEFKHLKDISASFYLLNLLAKEEERAIDLPIDKRTNQCFKASLKKLIESATTNSSEMFSLVYGNCVRKVWLLLREFIPWYKRFFLRNKFFQQATRDVRWLLRFVNEIYDYWLLLGKQIGLAAALKTGAQKTGARAPMMTGAKSFRH